ncbi:PAS domain-containing protein [Azospirillum sp. CT11-132]|uniref:PAS domain-containing protein n=1 Tax=Azospirillum sp. CT11-132 TaxID=3396317 RepID=UPI0039A75419
MALLHSLDGIPMPIAEMARSTDEAGGAVLVFDADDRILLANEEQRRMMPCCPYGKDDTYTTFFWSALNKGLTGNPVAKENPEKWLAGAIGARRNSPNLDFVNTYSWGRMLVSHVLLENGISIQTRLNMNAAGMGRYFDGAAGCSGVTRAIQLRKEIRSLEAMLDGLGLAVALVDGAGCILHANASFMEMLSASDGLTNKTGNSIASRDPFDETVLKMALKNVSERKSISTYVAIRRACNEPLVLAVSAGAFAGTVIISALRFGEDLSEVNSALTQAFGVSASEAEVMAGLGAGLSPAQLSGQRGVSTQASYRHIDNAKKKIRKNRFAALDSPGIASLVAGIAAITRAPSGRNH